MRQACSIPLWGATTAADKLCLAIAANMKEFDRFQAHIRVMNRETGSLRPELRKLIKIHMLGYIDIFRTIIDEGISAGDFRPIDAHLFANFIAMLCDVWPLRNWSVGFLDWMVCSAASSISSCIAWRNRKSRR